MKSARFLETVSEHSRQFGPRIIPELLFYGESDRYSAIGSLGLRYWQGAIVRTGLENGKLHSYFFYAAESDLTSGMFIASKQAYTPLVAPLVISGLVQSGPFETEARIHPKGQVSVVVHGLPLAEKEGSLLRS